MADKKRESPKVSIPEIPPATLYKYMTEARIEVISNRKIRFTQPHLLNDPFEVKPVFRDLFSKSDFEDVVKAGLEKIIRETGVLDLDNPRDEKKYHEAMRAIENKIRGGDDALFTMMNDASPRLEESFRRQTEKKIAILSLTEDRNNLLMWSHYANQHFGFVVGFRSDHRFINCTISDSDEMRRPRRVIYRNDRPRITNRALSMEPDLLFDTLYLTKSIEWSYEKEWRVVMPSEDRVDVKPQKGGDVLLYDAPHDAISEIVIGARASKEFCVKLAYMMRDTPSLHHVRLYKAATSYERYGLDFFEVRYSLSPEAMNYDLFSPRRKNPIRQAAQRYSHVF
ncbi:DUF2971 domain-containing protein [Azospirillum argentinense]|uniref:DUF2971 domain-containing protein n=1 Tax=Azospirillum argentinense TaxID=2970906 RepID=UPI001585FB1E|nr:DUF2971 domain-containing protein [Azospirillum argentinense]